MQKEGTNDTANNSGLASVILGIISIIFAFGINLHGTVIGVIGLIFAFIQRKKSNNKWAKWGIILNIIGIILCIAILVFVAVVLTKQLQSSGILDQINQLSQLKDQLGSQQYGQ